jgi:hypothetical protein
MASALARATAVALAVLTLAACGSSDDAAGPGDVSVSEAKALDEAAEMIEARKPPPPVANPSAPLPPELPAPATPR